MIALPGSGKGLLKPSSVCIDNTVFRLHYKFTTAVLLVCCLLILCSKHFGNPIDCMVEGDEKRNNEMDNYCWNHLTFGPSHAVDNEIKQIPHPGVATSEDGDELKNHKNYQWPWVCLMLFFQAMFFLLPHYLWKALEGGKCEMMVTKNPNETPLEQQERITNYFTQIMNTDNFYFYYFFFCEVLNLCNVIAQIFFMDVFLGNEFTTHGLGVFRYVNMSPEERSDPMTHVFPQMAMCTFQGKPGQCVLSINSLNEMIYVVMWFWFIVVAVVTALMLLFRLAMLRFRELRLQWPVMPYGLASPSDVRLVEKKCRIGDWFFLCQIGQNMDPVTFKELIVMLKKRLCG